MGPSVKLDELEAIRDPARASGYRGVYRHRDRWQARGGRRRGASGGGSPVLGTFGTPAEAGKAVVAWWKTTYGPRWREALRAASATPVVVAHTPDRRAVRVTAWFDGVAVVVAEVPGPAPAGGFARYANEGEQFEIRQPCDPLACRVCL